MSFKQPGSVEQGTKQKDVYLKKTGRLDIDEEGMNEDGVRGSQAIDLSLKLNVGRTEDHAKEIEIVGERDKKNKKIEVEARLEGNV